VLWDAERMLLRALRACVATLCHPVPFCTPETGVMGTAQSASPIGSQFPSLQHSDHSAPLGAGFLLQSDNDDIPSSPTRETRETSHALSNGDC